MDLMDSGLRHAGLLLPRTARCVNNSAKGVAPGAPESSLDFPPGKYCSGCVECGKVQWMFPDCIPPHPKSSLDQSPYWGIPSVPKVGAFAP